MHILPIEDIVPLWLALAAFGLGITVWVFGKRRAEHALFAIIAFSVALWATADWIRFLETTATPSQLVLWRVLFYVSISFAPAFAFHLASVSIRRSIHWTGGMVYAFGSACAAALNTAFITMNAEVLRISMFCVVSLTAFTIVSIAMMMYPVFRDTSLSQRERRWASYGVLILVPYLMVILLHSFTLPLSSRVVMTVFAVFFFAISSAALRRVRFLDVDISLLEIVFILLVAGCVITLLRISSIDAAAVASGVTVLVGIFGWRAIRLARHESRRRAELEQVNAELERLDRARRDVVAAVAHQLRGPLGGIRFAADMFSRGDFGPLSEEGTKVMDHIRASTDRLLVLAETSLNAARIEAGIFQPVVTEVDVATELRMLVADLAVSARAKGIRMDVSVHDLPPRLPLDRDALVNAVYNVLDNAVKYTDVGVITIEATYQHQLLRIRITDTGTGLSDEDKRTLFQKFSRGEEARRRVTDGTGLGLYVARKLVEELGGSITASSPGPGKGSTFCIELPARLTTGGSGGTL